MRFLPGSNMPRPKGSPNKIPRELRAAAKSLLDNARLKEQIVKLKVQIARLKKK